MTGMRKAWLPALGVALALCARLGAALAQGPAVEIVSPQANDGGGAQAIQPPPATSADDAAASTAMAVEQLMPITVGKDWAPPKLDLRAAMLPTDESELIRYLAEGYFPRETELTIDEAVAIALERNHDLNSKRLSAAAACQGVAINWAALRPELDLQAKAYARDNNAKSSATGGSTQTSSQNQTTTSLAFTLTQRIYDWGLTNKLIDVARAQYAIRNAAVDMAEQQLVANVIGSYYQFSEALGETRIRQDELALAEAVLSQAQLRFKVGTVPRLDVVRAEARVELARGDLVAALAALGDTAASFYAWLGVEDQRYVPAIITVPLIEVGDAPPPVDTAAKTAIETRPEMQMQCATLLAGKASIGLASNHPVLQAYANLTLQHPAGQSGTAFAEYGLQLNWTLFNGGKDEAGRKQAELQFKALSEGLLNLEAQIELDATRSWDRLYSARASVQSAKKNLELTVEALRIAAVGYSAGVITYTDYRDALDSNIAAALACLGSLIEVKLAQVDLERAQGFPAGYAGDTRANRDGSGAVQESASTGGQDEPAVAEKDDSHEK